MYIRSQDKEELVKLSRLSINWSNDNYYISAPDISSYHSMGEYNSKERSIEILDELQTAIDRGLSTFNMPKE